ncbi:ABC transporter ATP-binding protein [Agrilactobacillus fermenti]|uniref:ABC transporter ATP-binding protein n=1 Tax=Agrilactobacillus fermenti TaxID=2586909 RepID=UPI001E5D9847|nr:ABC transporter ATP-binding protein [Agrilactobacillus fermenti]MCD2257323.1 ABC transporter ATP-binding protein [Agrilactobacillus fermenti]
MIQLTNIIKKFGNHTVLNNISLTIGRGEMVAIMGPSGSGKSTLLNILGLVDSFDAGDYQFDDYSNIKPNSRLANRMIRERINYIFQNFALIDNETVAQNLEIAQKYLKLNQKAKKQQIKTVLAKVNLAGFEQRKVYELSGGQQQRVAVARCLIKPSELILADEPTGSLDEKNRDIILKEISHMNEEGKTVVIVTHDPKVAEFCSRIIYLS